MVGSASPPNHDVCSFRLPQMGNLRLPLTGGNGGRMRTARRPPLGLRSLRSLRPRGARSPRRLADSRHRRRRSDRDRTPGMERGHFCFALTGLARRVSRSEQLRQVLISDWPQRHLGDFRRVKRVQGHALGRQGSVGADPSPATLRDSRVCLPPRQNTKATAPCLAHKKKKGRQNAFPLTDARSREARGASREGLVLPSLLRSRLVHGARGFGGFPYCGTAS